MHGQSNNSQADDISFLLGEVLEWNTLFSLPAYSHVDPDLASMVIQQASKLAFEVISPINAAADSEASRLEDGRVRVPPVFHDAYRAITGGGWIGLDMPRQYGGQGLPLAVQLAFAELLNGACMSLGMLPVMQRAASVLLLRHAEEAFREMVVPRLVSGDWAATICITEAQAGSDVGRINTTASELDGERYQLSGSKVFISYGDHDLTRQIIHLVLARTPGAPVGSRGLSLFIVPRLNFDDESRNAVSVSRVENKMGLRASPTCELVFDKATAYRVGDVGQGLHCMFTMVNLMRLEVSIQGPAIASQAFMAAKAYSQIRKQGGQAEAKPVSLDSHADVQRMLLSMQARAEGSRALVYETAFNLDLAKAQTDSKKAAEARKLAEFLLPVCKSIGSETGFDVANMAIQVFGGYGYIRETGVEQYLRDARVAMIYEGTNGIQALDLVQRKLVRDQGERYQLFATRVKTAIEHCRPHEHLHSVVEALERALAHLESATSLQLSRGKPGNRDIEASASDYLSLVGLVGCGWMWLRILAVIEPGSKPGSEKYAAGQFFSRYHMPESSVLLERIKQGSELLSNTPSGATS